MDAGALDAEGDAQVDAGPLRGWLTAVTALGIAIHALHLGCHVPNSAGLPSPGHPATAQGRRGAPGQVSRALGEPEVDREWPWGLGKGCLPSRGRLALHPPREGTWPGPRGLSSRRAWLKAVAMLLCTALTHSCRRRSESACRRQDLGRSGEQRGWSEARGAKRQGRLADTLFNWSQLS